MLHEGHIVPCTQALAYYYLTDWQLGERAGLRHHHHAGMPLPLHLLREQCLCRYLSWGGATFAAGPSPMRSPNSAPCASSSLYIQRSSCAMRHLANPPEYIAEFCREYRRHVNLPFRSYTTAQTADPQKLQMLVEAGLCYVIMGIQSGVDNTQTVYQRHVSNERMLQAAHTLHSLGSVLLTYYVITDNPYESSGIRSANPPVDPPTACPLPAGAVFINVLPRHGACQGRARRTQ